MELQQKIKDSTRPMIEQYEKIKRLADSASPIIADMTFSSPSIDAIKEINDNSMLQDDAFAKTVEIANIPILNESNLFSSLEIGSGILETVNRLSEKLNSIFSNQITTFVNNISSAFITAVQSPMMQWLQSFDFTHVWEFLKDIDPNIDYLQRYKQLNASYLSAMYECKWFPYAGWISDITLFSTISEIIYSSRGTSKRREKRIDTAIISYYTKAELKNIKREWKSTELEYHIKKILSQAIDAHLRGEYALTISCLATMWEGMIKSKLAETQKPSKEDFRNLVGDNGFDKIFSDFYNNMIISTCYSVEDVVEGVPNRHGVAHSWYVKYPTKKASLNAILLTDFIINLKPKEISEKVE